MAKTARKPTKPTRKPPTRKPPAAPEPAPTPATLPPINNATDIRAALIDLLAQQAMPLDYNSTLLCDPKYWPAERDARKCTLSKEVLFFVSHKPDSYRRMIMLITLGGSVPNVALLAGIPRSKLNLYRRQGLNDQANNKDTYCSRFVNDINYAATLPAVESEIVICKRQPLDWLTQGPGRWLNPEGTWQKSGTPPEAKPESVGTAEPEIVVTDDSDFDMSGPTVMDLSDILDTAKECGLLEHVFTVEGKLVEGTHGNVHGETEARPQSDDHSG